MDDKDTIKINLDGPEQQPEEKREVVEDKGESIEERARSLGWIDPDTAKQRGIDEKDIVDAKTFVDREPFIQRIKLLDKRNRTMASKVDELLNRFERAELDGYNRALKELEAQKDQAIDDLDTKRAREIDQEIAKQKQAAQTVQQRMQENKSNANPEATAFVERNSDWWGKDQRSMQYASAVEQQILIEEPDIDLEDLYNKVQQKVDVFRGVASKEADEPKDERRKPSPVAPPTRASGGHNSKDPASYGFHDLTSEAKDIYKSMQQYKKDEFNEDYTVKQFIESQLKAGLVQLDELVQR